MNPIKVQCRCNVDKVRKFSSCFPTELPCKPNVGDNIIISTGIKSKINGFDFTLHLKVCGVSFEPQYKRYGDEKQEWRLVIDLHFPDSLSIIEIDKWFLDHIGV